LNGPPKNKIQGLRESTYETHLVKIGPLASKLVQANLALIQSLKDEYQSWVL